MYYLLMTKQMKILIGLIILIVLALGIFYFTQKSKKDLHVVAPTPTDKTNARFEWVYESKGEKDGIPQTTVSLAGHYVDGTSDKTYIDDIEGGCNEYASPDKDVYKGSTEIMCYYAGFGIYYKVVQSGEHYLVQKKEFEEASPDYNPPVQEFKTILQF